MDGLPRFRKLNASAIEGRVAVTIDLAGGEEPSAFFECDTREFGRFIEQALGASDRLSRQLMSGAGTPQPGDGTRGVVVLPAEEVDVQPSARGVRLVIRCGLVDLALQLPTKKATSFAARFHAEAQRQAAREDRGSKA